MTSPRPLRSTEPRLDPVPAAMAPPRDSQPPPTPAREPGEIKQLAGEIAVAGKDARKVTLLGAGNGEGITLTALTLGRLLARDAKVVLIGLSESPATLAEASIDPAAPGLADLMMGDASFGQIITKDRLSRLHLVSAGRSGTDRALLQSPRLGLAFDALLCVYDHVLLDAGTATDLPAELLTNHARAIVVPDPTMSAEARALMAEQLKAVGFSVVTMLTQAASSQDIADTEVRTVAA